MAEYSHADRIIPKDSPIDEVLLKPLLTRTYSRWLFKNEIKTIILTRSLATKADVPHWRLLSYTHARPVIVYVIDCWNLDMLYIFCQTVTKCHTSSSYVVLCHVLDVSLFISSCNGANSFLSIRSNSWTK